MVLFSEPVSIERVDKVHVKSDGYTVIHELCLGPFFILFNLFKLEVIFAKFDCSFLHEENMMQIFLLQLVHVA